MTTKAAQEIGEEQIIRVDENDRCVGFIGKHAAHEGGGVLHRAFSIFIFNAQQQVLLQQRSLQKYHFGGRWTNTCCSHPRRDEAIEAAAHRRLQEECGFDVPLQEIFSFVYQAHDADSNLTEWEYDHVFIGEFNGEPTINEAEIAAWKWMNLADVRLDMERNPQCYTAWFHIALDKVIDCVGNDDPLGDTKSGG